MSKHEEIDPAKKLADQFKKQGHFDKIKQDMLLGPIDNTDSTPLQDFIKTRVSAVVQTMVKDDESLIFKNRGSTSALIEGQLLKDGYRKLDTDTISVDARIRKIFEQPQLTTQLKETLVKELGTSEDYEFSTDN